MFRSATENHGVPGSSPGLAIRNPAFQRDFLLFSEATSSALFGHSIGHRADSLTSIGMGAKPVLARRSHQAPVWRRETSPRSRATIRSSPISCARSSSRSSHRTSCGSSRRRACSSSCAGRSATRSWHRVARPTSSSRWPTPTGSWSASTATARGTAVIRSSATCWPPSSRDPVLTSSRRCSAVRPTGARRTDTRSPPSGTHRTTATRTASPDSWSAGPCRSSRVAAPPPSSTGSTGSTPTAG
jgi:hypothetical protein